VPAPRRQGPEPAGSREAIVQFIMNYRTGISHGGQEMSYDSQHEKLEFLDNAIDFFFFPMAVTQLFS